MNEFAFSNVLHVQVSMLSRLTYNKTATFKKEQKLVSRHIIAECRLNVLQMFQKEHSAIRLTFINLPLVIKIFVLSIFEWPLKTGFTVL